MKKQVLLNIFIISIIAIGFLFLNTCQPMFADDFGRSYPSALTRGNLFGIVYDKYFNWTGRVSAEFLAYVLLNKDHIIISLFAINTLNSIIFSIFIVLSFKIVSQDKYKIGSKQFVCFLFFFCFVFLYCGFIGNALWKTVAIQYFWGIVLLTGYYYITFLRQKNSIAFSIFTGLFIGLYNEIYVGVIVILAMAYFLERKLNTKTINKNVIYFFVAIVAAGTILFIAPGNYKRLDVLAGPREITLTQNISFMLQLLLYHPHAKLLRYMIAVTALLFILSQNIKAKSAVIYFIALIISLFVLTPVVGQYGGLNQRVLMIYYLMFFLVAFRLLYSSQKEFIIKLFKLINNLSWLLAIILIFKLWVVFSAYISLHNHEIQRQQLIDKYHKNNIKDATFPTSYRQYLYVDNNYGFIYFDDITNNENDWRNKGFAWYYGFDSVKLRK